MRSATEPPENKSMQLMGSLLSSNGNFFMVINLFNNYTVYAYMQWLHVSNSDSHEVDTIKADFKH